MNRKNVSADTGFAGIECAGFFPPQEEVRAAADARGIKIVAQWFSSFILRDGVEAVVPDFEAACARLEYLGATRVVVSEQTGSVQDIRDMCIFNSVTNSHQCRASRDKLMP